MKMYTTTSPTLLLHAARLRLFREGFVRGVVPDYEWHTRYVPRSVKGLPDEGYWSTDFSLYTDETHSVRSPYAPAARVLRGAPGVKAATYDQWGIFLGALLDEAHETGTAVRIVGEYDPLGKRAPRMPDGKRFRDSRDLFSYLTCGTFGEIQRTRGTVDLSCLAHRWIRTDLIRCEKCDRIRR